MGLTRLVEEESRMRQVKSHVDSSVSRLWAIMPVKNIENAKQRLASALTPAERCCLFAAMVEDVLSTMSRCRSLAGVLVVTRDPEAMRLAKRYDARVLVENSNAGHTAASRFGAQTLAAEGIAGMIQIPGDLPAMTSEDVDTVLAAHGEAPAVTIAPSHDELGSNAVACSPPDLLPLRFGEDSFFRHLERARALGIEPAIIKRDGLALDIDSPEDLISFLAKPCKGRTLTYLRESGIAERLSDQQAR